MKLLKRLFKNYNFTCTKGNNNQIIAVKEGKEYPIYKHKGKLKIEGDNNRIIINCDNAAKIPSSLPKGLDITISGNNNLMEFEWPIKFHKAIFNSLENNNSIRIKRTDKTIADVWINVSTGFELFIDEDCSIGQGDFTLTANNNYHTPHKIYIGKHFRAAKDTIIRASDGHSILNPTTKEAVNEPQDIIIGNNVWIMTRCMVVKGAVIPDGWAVAPYSFVNKNFAQMEGGKGSCLLAGIPAKVKKENFIHNIKSYGEYMKSFAD